MRTKVKCGRLSNYNSHATLPSPGSYCVCFDKITFNKYFIIFYRFVIEDNKIYNILYTIIQIYFISRIYVHTCENFLPHKLHFFFSFYINVLVIFSFIFFFLLFSKNPHRTHAQFYLFSRHFHEGVAASKKYMEKKNSALWKYIFLTTMRINASVYTK